MINFLISLVKGTTCTIILTLGSSILGFVLGLLLAVEITQKKNKLCIFWTDLLRGTPLLLQALLLKGLVGAYLPDMALAIIAFGINSSAYTSQILCSAINSVNVNQMEAGQDLGLSPLNAFISVVLPQAIKNSAPALTNEFCSLLKESAVAGVIDIHDLMSAAEGVARSANCPLISLLIASIIYYILSRIGIYAIKRITHRKR